VPSDDRPAGGVLARGSGVTAPSIIACARSGTGAAAGDAGVVRGGGGFVIGVWPDAGNRVLSFEDGAILRRGRSEADGSAVPCNSRAPRDERRAAMPASPTGLQIRTTFDPAVRSTAMTVRRNTLGQRVDGDTPVVGTSFLQANVGVSMRVAGPGAAAGGDARACPAVRCRQTVPPCCRERVGDRRRSVSSRKAPPRSHIATRRPPSDVFPKVTA
jgi:hypothetical protein